MSKKKFEPVLGSSGKQKLISKKNIYHNISYDAITSHNRDRKALKTVNKGKKSKILRIYFLGNLVNHNSRLRTMSTAQKTSKPFERIYQNTKFNGRSRRTKSFTQTKLKSYINATGPGDYDLPNLWGSLKTVSNYNNSPFFSMGQR